MSIKLNYAIVAVTVIAFMGTFNYVSSSTPWPIWNKTVKKKLKNSKHKKIKLLKSIQLRNHKEIQLTDKPDKKNHIKKIEKHE